MECIIPDSILDDDEKKKKTLVETKVAAALSCFLHIQTTPKFPSFNSLSSRFSLSNLLRATIPNQQPISIFPNSHNATKHIQQKEKAMPKASILT